MHTDMLRILLVDDNDIDCFITQRLFGHVNHPIDFRYMTNTEDALKFLAREGDVQENLPHILLVDLYMAPVSGMEFLEELYRATQGNHAAYIVVISSSTNPPITRLRELGMCEFVPKPLTIDKMIGLLENYEPCKELSAAHKVKK